MTNITETIDAAQTTVILQKQPELKTFSAGETIFKEGDSGDFMYGIVEGEVDILVNDKIGETIQRGEVFGMGALVGVGTRTYTAIAKTDCQLAFLNRYRFLFAVQETPVFALKVMQSYSERLARLTH